MGKVKYHFLTIKRVLFLVYQTISIHSKPLENNQNTGIPLVNIFTYEMNKYWNI
ncbi:FIG00643509: hypothetical protein [Escherichia coli ISC7]|uniref:Uncharacterized protein n=1 Tax=Escherichia coli ISC7 TaxID=1432555 RepID=W1EUU1_ECOLX|nr:FIG00643509: hypothetical protein [Escherichia coli ISC7]